MTGKNSKDMRILSSEKGMFQYFFIFHLPEKNKIHSQSFKSKSCLQNHVDQHIELSNNTIIRKSNSKKVTFADKPSTKIMHVWQFAHAQARKGEWQLSYIDHMHFKLRIQILNEIISPVLTEKYKKFVENS